MPKGSHTSTGEHLGDELFCRGKKNGNPSPGGDWPTTADPTVGAMVDGTDPENDKDSEAMSQMVFKIEATTF